MRIRKYIACIMMVFLIGASLPVYAQEKNDASSQDIIIDGEEPENNDSENEKSDVENDVLLEDSAGDKEESIVNSNQDNELNEGNGEVSEENKQESERQEEETLATPETDAFAELTEISVSDGWYAVQAFDNKGLCLDVINSSDKDGAEIQLYKSVFTLAQRFLIERKENGWYTIQNISSNKYLGVEGGIPEDQEETVYEVLQWTGNGSEAQEFKFYQDEKGTVIIQVHEGEKLVLDTEAVGTGKRLKASAYGEKSSQKFSLRQEKTPGMEVDIEEGTYRIYPSQASGVSLDLWDASHKKGANIQLYTANGTSAQEWKISKQGSWYKITSAESSMVLDVAGGKSGAGTNLQQWTSNSGKGQFFRFIKQEMANTVSCRNWEL